MVVEIVAYIEEEGQFPQAHSAFDNGVLTLELTRLIESKGKHWVSEVESSRHILWQDQGRRLDEVAARLRQTHPPNFRPVSVRCRDGVRQEVWGLPNGVRLNR